MSAASWVVLSAMSLSDEMTTAASSNDVDTVRRLLDAGEGINATNDRGETAFSYACANNALKVAELLHARGANINTVDAGGGSPLDWAVCWSSLEFRAWLKRIGGTRHDDSYAEVPWPREGTRGTK
jgi:metal-dependent HD superfamily phosphatase/phosphodiesterase